MATQRTAEDRPTARLSLALAGVLLLTACGRTAVSTPSMTGSTAGSVAPSATASSSAPSSVSDRPAPSPTERPLEPSEPASTAELNIDGDTPQFITSRRGGFVALGSEHVWVSEDGQTWDAMDASPPDGTVVRVVEGSHGTLLAFGYVGDLRSGEEFRTWTSSDGREWQAVDLGLPAAFIVLDIGRSARGHVLVGRTLLDDASPEQIWFTSDADYWELAYSTTDNESLSAVGAGPEGFVAVGQQGFRTGPSRAFVLASADGRQWIKADDADGVLAEAGSLWSVVPLGGDWVTSPSVAGTALPILWSANGIEWSERASLEVEREEAGVIAYLMSNGTRLFAAVSSGNGEPAFASLLTSTDAVTFTETDLPIITPWQFATASGVDVFLADGILHVHRE